MSLILDVEIFVFCDIHLILKGGGEGALSKNLETTSVVAECLKKSIDLSNSVVKNWLFLKKKKTKSSLETLNDIDLQSIYLL